MIVANIDFDLLKKESLHPFSLFITHINLFDFIIIQVMISILKLSYLIIKVKYIVLNLTQFPKIESCQFSI